MSRAPQSMAGIDVGGTFTDLVSWDGENLVVGKVPTTPHDQSYGVLDAVTTSAVAPTSVVHGTTVATNALLERRGARTALVTTAGFEDVLEIGRQDRPSLYDSMADRPEPLAAQRVGVDRVDPLSSALPPLDNVESIAVSLLYGFRAGDAERDLGERLATEYPGVPISLSSEVVAEFREFERTSTTVLNAYLRPEVGRYLDRLAEGLQAAGIGGDVAVMRSSGGLMSLSDAALLPVAALLSGPAGGVVAAARLSLDMGFERAVSFDMGGTSTDVSRIERGEAHLTFERPIAGYPCRMATVDIHTVGAGGGSIAWMDAGGSLRVGPQSAGAVPGPACYGAGGSSATVTDANVLLGRLGALGKSIQLDREAALTAMSSLAARLGITVDETAAGIVTVVEETMAGAIRKVSVEEGVDPRDAVLVAFGGAGGMHASALARRLHMKAAVVPRFAGVFSALGLLLSPPRVDVAQSISHPDELVDAADVVATTAGEKLAAATGAAGTTSLSADLRYVGQSHELSLTFDRTEPIAKIAERFHEVHQQRNGFSRPHDAVEIVTVRAVSRGQAAISWDELPPPDDPIAIEAVPRRIAAADGSIQEGLVYARESLGAGLRIAGPAVIEDGAATTYLDTGDIATVADNGALLIEW